jgi:hypothetical protein
VSAEQSEFPEVALRTNAWFHLFRRWRLLNWALSITIAGGSAFVASSLSESMGIREWAALAVAVCAALQSTLQPERRATAYREAWVTLDLAAMAYGKTPKPLIEALRGGEIRISGMHSESGKEPLQPALGGSKNPPETDTSTT